MNYSWAAGVAAGRLDASPSGKAPKHKSPVHGARATLAQATRKRYLAIIKKQHSYHSSLDSEKAEKFVLPFPKKPINLLDGSDERETLEVGIWF